jgi:hypothetical protein
MAGTARVLGNATSNHDINGVATNVIAGSAIPGPSHHVTGVVPAGTNTAACSKFVLPTVDPGTSATTNDNASRTDACVAATQIPTPCTVTTTLSIGFPPVVTTTTSTTGGVQYDATAKTLRVWGNGRTILNGATYSFCSIRLEGSGTLLVKASTPITRIFLRDPSECAGVPNAGQIIVDGTSKIVNCHGQTQPETLQLYARGATTQTFAGAGTLTAGLMLTACGTGLSLTGVPMVIYAPNSRVELGGTTTLAGQVVGNTVAMSGSAAVQPVNALVNLNQLGGRPVLPLYQPVDYVECTGRTFEQLPPENPAQGC